VTLPAVGNFNRAPELAPISRPRNQSLTAEAFQALLTSILYTGRKRRSRVLIVPARAPAKARAP